ncbi:39S ribosomal protein L44, mitochondrial [Lamellibrachia satsuma]|nr:39S ribosomal protein L44, mitochondrial [Lamellibrachia satsuma]
MSSVLRNVLSLCARRAALSCRLTAQRHPTSVRCYKKWVQPVNRTLYKRRMEQGPEPERHRSEWLNWNYSAEMFAFGHRLGESFSEDTLQKALTDISYVELENKKRKGLQTEEEGEELNLDIPDNEQLSRQGEKLCQDFVKGYLRHTYPNLPEDGVSAICEYLMGDEMLAYIGTNLGLNDIILTSEFPVSAATVSKTFSAVIGALHADQGAQRAQLFVHDFVLTQLTGKTLDSMWTISNPMGLLAAILAKQGMAEPEPRLLWETGSETVVAAYMVGIYSNKTLIGKAPGETVSIAERMAAQDALQRFFNFHNDSVIHFDRHSLKVDTDHFNTSKYDYMSQYETQNLA